MAKKTLTGFTADVDNVQALADQPTQSAATLKEIFDTAGNEVKADGNTLVTELASTTEGDSGAHAIGLGLADFTADNVGDGLQEVYDAIAGIALGSIPDNSITAAKMADDMDKGVAGGVEAYNDALTHKQSHINHIHYAAATGSANVYAVSLDASVTSLSEGFAVAFKPNATNTGTSTLNVNGIGAVTIKTPSGANVSAGQLVSGNIYTLRYNGTNFILQGEGAIGNMVAADLLSGKTGTTAAGLVTGTMTNRAGDTAALSSTVSGTTLKLLASSGYRDGVDDYVTKTDANFIASNIKIDVPVMGLTGSLLTPGTLTLSGTEKVRLDSTKTKIGCNQDGIFFIAITTLSTNYEWVDFTTISLPSGVTELGRSYNGKGVVNTDPNTAILLLTGVTQEMDVDIEAWTANSTDDYVGVKVTCSY